MTAALPFDEAVVLTSLTYLIVPVCVVMLFLSTACCLAATVQTAAISVAEL
jgi:hypothetical protein